MPGAYQAVYESWRADPCAFWAAAAERNNQHTCLTMRVKNSCERETSRKTTDCGRLELHRPALSTAQGNP